MKKTLLAALGTLSVAAAVLFGVPAALDLDPDKSEPKQADGPKMTVKKFAEAPDVKNITAICFDEQGDLYLTETNRFRRGVEDNRNHRYWLMEDIKAATIEDRRKMFQKWELQLGPEYFTTFEERVLRLRDSDEDGVADEIAEFAGGFKDMVDGPAIGILAGEGKIYMACIPNIWLLEDTDDDGVADKREVFQDGFGPKVSLSGHDLHGLVWGPDGKLYFSIGDRGFNLETREGRTLKDVNSGAVFRCEADGSNLEIYFHQLRNPQEIAFNEFGDLFTVDNNSDQGDQARICYLIEGGSAGWTIGNQHLTTFKDDIEDGGLGERPFWLTEELWKPQHEGQPKWIIPPLHNLTNGPSGLVFDSGIALPERYEKGHFLVCDYKGSAAQSFLWSFQVERDGAGYKVNDPHIFFAGVTNTDVDLGPDSKIYLADYGGGWQIPDRGAIYSLYHKPTHKRDIVKETEEILRSDFGEAETATLAGYLAHPDMRVRQRAQFELVKQESGSGVFRTTAFDPSQPLFARIHSIWGLQQTGNGDLIEKLLIDDDEEIQRQAVRALGELRYQSAISEIAELMESKNPRVKAAAAIASSKIIPTIPETRENDEIRARVIESAHSMAAHASDPFVRHAASMALQHFDPLPNFISESPALRLGELLGLRLRKDPEISSYFDDEDPSIAAEAIRAANDLEFPEEVSQQVMHDLANAARKFESGRLADFSYPVFLRLLNGCLRSGRAIDAYTLLLIAENEKLPKRHRLKSLNYLRNFLTPPPIDPTLGIYRPLPPRENVKTEISESSVAETLDGNFIGGVGMKHIRPRLLALIDGDDSRLASEAMKVASHFGMAPEEEKLIQWALHGERPLSIRLTSIELLAAHEGSAATSDALLKAVAFIQPKLRAAAVTSLATVAPGSLVDGARTVLAQETVTDRRAAYAALATSNESAAAGLIATELDELIDGSLRAELELDLYEAAIARDEPAVKTKLQTLLAKLATEGKTDAHFTLFGGNAVQGENVFNNQGTCLKCHIIGRMGGETGPGLTTIGVERKREHLFESLINSNAEISDGYGICSVTLEDGTVLTGTPLDESRRHLILKTAEAEPQKIKKSDIAQRTPTMSPMPPMGLTLPRRDLRDLMAYLVSLDQTDDD